VIGIGTTHLIVSDECINSSRNRVTLAFDGLIWTQT
jgi:hypothetical protein